MLISPTLLIFAKPPRMGLAKTRLARDIGPVEAQRLNRYCHARAMRAANIDGLKPQICVAPDRATSQRVGGLWPDAFERSPQGGGDLGDRLSRAFATSPPGPVLVIGTDTPQIRPRHIRAALNALRGHDAVIGPADDGGFWLFGASQLLRRRRLDFNPVRWSSEYAMTDLLATLPFGMRVARLETLIDLDDAHALKLWKATRR